MTVEIGNLTTLKYLDLRNNNLNGVIPNTILNHPHFNLWKLTPQNKGYEFDNLRSILSRVDR